MDDPERDSDLVIRKSVTVPLSQQDAFKLFTEGMGTWWPASPIRSPGVSRDRRAWTTA